MCVIVCEWRAWNRFLITALLPHAIRIPLFLDESADHLLRRLDRSALESQTVLFHINLSQPGRLPQRRDLVIRRLKRQGVDVWNACVHDISKAAIQRWNRNIGLSHTEASRRGHGSELLIVKTQENAFGAPERRLSSVERVALGYPRLRSTPIDGAEYPVLTREQIPAEWWRRSDLFVERFIENRENEFFRFYIAGPRCVLSHCFSDDIVKRTRSTHDRINYLLTRQEATGLLYDAVLPPSARGALRSVLRFADAFALDFGAIDVVCDDHQNPYIVDVNPTPWWGNDEQPGLLEHLRVAFEMERRRCDFHETNA